MGTSVSPRLGRQVVQQPLEDPHRGVVRVVPRCVAPQVQGLGFRVQGFRVLGFRIQVRVQN